jgi:hypothetical protein
MSCENYIITPSKHVIDLTTDMEIEPEPPIRPHIFQLMEAASTLNYKRFFSLFIQHENNISPKEQRQIMKSINNPERFVDIAVLFEMYELALSICKATGLKGCSGDDLENVLIGLHDPDSDSFHDLWRFLDYEQDTDSYDCKKCNQIFNYDEASDSSDYHSSSCSEEEEEKVINEPTQNDQNEPIQNNQNEESDVNSSDFDSSDGESVGLQSSSCSSSEEESESESESVSSEEDEPTQNNQNKPTQNDPNEPTQNDQNEGSDVHSSDFDSFDGESVGLQSSSIENEPSSSYENSKKRPIEIDDSSSSSDKEEISSPTKKQK